MSADPQTLGETEQPPEHAPQPLAPPPADPPAPDDDQPSEPTGKLKAPPQTSGFYVVLWARAPKRGDHDRPRYVEVAFYEASDQMAAKKKAMDDPANEHLRRSAAQKPGILLRAVPALSWPASVEPSAFENRPALVVR